MRINNYYPERLRELVQRGEHRSSVGGLWDEIGKLTFGFLIDRGLRPEMTFLDIGCGCLRIGVHLVDFLHPEGYFGVDLSADLLAAGYESELRPRRLTGKLPKGNLVADSEFRFARLPATRPFDMALALSLFTHLPSNHLRLCLWRLAPLMVRGAVLYATFFICDEEGKWSEPLVHEPGGIVTFPERDYYHYCTSDLRAAARGLPWSVGEPLRWGHPRGQAMVAFTRTGDLGG